MIPQIINELFHQYFEERKFDQIPMVIYFNEQDGIRIPVVIPVRKGGNPDVTIKHLKNQTHKNLDIIIVNDYDKSGAPWARNYGFGMCDTMSDEFVLFSDDDIEWLPDAVENLLKALLKHPEASYSYGSYEMNGQVQCFQEFNPELLKVGNYISTMSLIRVKDFPGFDENLKRLQDWDLWLHMLSQGKKGVQCGKLIFRTKPSQITIGDPTEAVKIIQKKWKL